MKKLGEQGLAKEKVEKDKAMFGGQEIKGKTLSVIGLGKCYRYYTTRTGMDSTGCDRSYISRPTLSSSS
jgi:D-3-phosphoglycerate dehydrogenase